MKNTDTRRVLINATKELLQSGEHGYVPTARDIASHAGVNLAMINYSFKSKDELIKVAVDEILSEEFRNFSAESDVDAKEQLRQTLHHFCSVMLRYSDFTRMTIPYLLLEDAISLPSMILPFLRTILQDETECRIIAYNLITILQVIFYRSDAYRHYSGIDINDSNQMNALIDYHLALFTEGHGKEGLAWRFS